MKPQSRQAALALVLFAAVALLVGLVLLSVGGIERLFYAGRFDVQPAPMEATAHPPGPRLQRAPAEELAALHAREALRLHRYGWIDRRHGIAHIPIERAMSLLEGRGLARPFEPVAGEAERLTPPLAEELPAWQEPS